MNKVLIFFMLLLTGCKEKGKDLGLVSKVEGTYPVYLYVHDKDTLISPEKGNLSRFKNFKIVVKPEDYNTVAIDLVSTEGTNSNLGEVEIESDGNKYRLTSPGNTVDTRFGYADGKEFYTTIAYPDTTKPDWPTLWTVIAGRR